MDLGLAEQITLIAGSSRGIGRAIAAAFLAEGARVILTGRDVASLEKSREALAASAGDHRVMSCAGDLNDQRVVEATLDRVKTEWGAIDCLIANVGTGRGKIGWELNDSDWSNLFEQNLWSGVRLVAKVLPQMMAAKRGSIVLVSSITGLEATKAPLPYSAAKAAVINYAKNLSVQVAPNGIRVNCVAPGNVLFPGGSWERHLEQRREEVMRFIEQEVPLRRFGQPEEIADLIVFLSSPRATFITGACVRADGGQTRSW
ncbi:MAG TPA: SDR family oxidoreductase [Planctomycetaceae bacterium]|jgi:3-oxoacyl-[acyl-carrier protein] reductase|nr:SDR family oxidoreductase [Planctomycetaceae bacterium]